MRNHNNRTRKFPHFTTKFNAVRLQANYMQKSDSNGTGEDRVFGFSIQVGFVSHVIL